MLNPCELKNIGHTKASVRKAREREREREKIAPK
jgi:hypothetical protein